eukprot:5447949-Pleurochrysis_carterae.AAC.1
MSRSASPKRSSACDEHTHTHPQSRSAKKQLQHQHQHARASSANPRRISALASFASELMMTSQSATANE